MQSLPNRGGSGKPVRAFLASQLMARPPAVFRLAPKRRWPTRRSTLRIVRQIVIVMDMTDRPIRLDIFKTALPMRSFEHAAATRKVAESIVVRLTSESGRVGWGETLPRAYVTGETLESVPADIESLFWPHLRECQGRNEVRTLLPQLTLQVDGRAVTAARCAIELAAMQAYETFSPDGWSPPEEWPSVSGVLGSADPAKTARKLRLMRWYGLRHFKLKLGFSDEVDQANLRAVHRQLARGLSDGRFTLRVDVNSAWSYNDTPAKVAQLRREFGVCAVEQPTKARPARFVDLAMTCELPLIADESAVTEDDVEVLLGAEGRVWLNVRISKNGGLGPAMRLARLARANGVPYVLGCMVGESGILSLAQRSMLASGASPGMLEGNFGQFLLKDDLTATSPRFGYRGRIWPVGGGRGGLYIPQVRGDKLQQYGTLLKTLG
jgi:L-Ala-D/L-Glu epimerase